jgi:hypothetical protein
VSSVPAFANPQVANLLTRVAALEALNLGARVEALEAGGGLAPQTVVDFRTISALPTDWVKSTAASLTFSTGMTISAGVDFSTNFVASPTIGIYQGRSIRIDFIGAAPSTAVGLANPDTGGLFTNNNSIAWLDSGALWTGSAPVFTATSYGAAKLLRLVLIAIDGQWVVRFFHDLGTGYVQTHETSLPQTAQMGGFTRIYIDSGEAAIKLLEVAY